MLNKEKYAKEILDIVCSGEIIGKSNGHLRPCKDIDDCSNCEFNIDLCCDSSGQFAKWANSEYKEHEVDWSKVPVDTCILVTDSYGYTMKRHFAKYDNKKIYAYPDGTTSWSYNQVEHKGLVDWDEKNVQIKEGVNCSEWYKD